MDEDRQVIEAVKALGLGELIPQIYRDMLQPAALQVGDVLATIAKGVKIALAPVEACVWGYDKVREWLPIRVTRILADRKVKKVEAPPLPIAGPLVSQLIYAKDVPELKELYASLLASAMDPKETSAHPSFVSIIQQLTPDEARILRYIAQNYKGQAFLCETEGEGVLIDAIQQQFKTLCKKAGIVHVRRSEFYKDNLVRLRILNEEFGGNAVYVKDNESFGNLGPMISNLEWIHLKISAFGCLFLDTCIEKRDSTNIFNT